MMYDDIKFVNEEEKAKEIIESVWGKKPLFACVIANTETGKIKGVSIAGENPDITDYTPPADVELVELGKCKCIDGVPITPEGIPTPAGGWFLPTVGKNASISSLFHDLPRKLNHTLSSWVSATMKSRNLG